MMNQNFGSFRDPAGYVLESGSHVYRTIRAPGSEDYTLFQDSGLAQELLRRRWIPAFSETSESVHDSWKVLEVERLPWISYPYEWSFHQLKEAALLTLRIQKKALEFGMSLKDASAYNVQLFQARPVFIDLQSFERYEEGKPWAAYRQFVMHFLGPILLMAQCDVRYGQMFRTWLDGFPVDFVSRALPRRSHWSMSTLMHIHWHARMIAKHANTQGKTAGEASARPMKPLAKSSLLDILESLEAMVKSATLPETRTEWGDYYNDTNYSDAAFRCKKELVTRICTRLQPSMVCDLGANCGEFSRQIPKSVPVVVSADIDPIAVEKNYIITRKQGDQNIYPILLDLCNPTPGVGWMNAERKSFMERGKCDLALGLALLHHLCIGNNLPLEYVAKFFAAMAPNVVVEFVPKEDSQTQRLLSSREDIFPRYNLKNCIQAFGEYFTHMEQYPIAESKRTLLVFGK